MSDEGRPLGTSKKVIWFITLVLVLSWAAVFSMKYFNLGRHPMTAVMVIPLLLALAFSLASGKKKIARIGWRIPAGKDCLIALFLPLGQIAMVVFSALVLNLVSVNSHHVIFSRPTPHVGLNLILALPALFIPYLLLSPPVILIGWLNHLGEEFAWRGYLFKEISIHRQSMLAGVLISGAVWWAWHLPMFFLSPVLNALLPWEKVLTVGLSLISLLGTAVIYSWIYVKSGSIWTPTLMHLTWNLYRNILTGSLADGSPGLFAGDLWIVNGEGVIGMIVTSLTGLLFAYAWFGRCKKTGTVY